MVRINCLEQFRVRLSFERRTIFVCSSPRSREIGAVCIHVRIPVFNRLTSQHLNIPVWEAFFLPGVAGTHGRDRGPSRDVHRPTVVCQLFDIGAVITCPKRHTQDGPARSVTTYTLTVQLDFLGNACSARQSATHRPSENVAFTQSARGRQSQWGRIVSPSTRPTLRTAHHTSTSPTHTATRPPGPCS